MARLRPVARVILKRNAYKQPIISYLNGAIDWEHQSLKPIKDLIRAVLRAEQQEVCPYCQRLIIPERRNLNEHIEHYLDKSKQKYRKFAFTATNLVLSCNGCNVEKSTRDLIDPLSLAPMYLSAASGPFLWPHPYFDDMNGCILKSRGPVYSAVPASGRVVEAQRLISDLKLNEIRNIESRYGKLKARHERLMKILGRLARRNNAASQARMVPLVLEMERVYNDLF